mgnify:CR=1 FL=1
MHIIAERWNRLQIHWNRSKWSILIKIHPKWSKSDQNPLQLMKTWSKSIPTDEDVIKTHPRWWKPYQNPSQLMKILSNSTPNDEILVKTHPEWWRSGQIHPLHSILTSPGWRKILVGVSKYYLDNILNCEILFK